MSEIKPISGLRFILHPFILSFFSEVVKTESRRGLIFFFISDACYNKYKNGNYIRKHLKKFFSAYCNIRDVCWYYIQKSEQYRTEDAYRRAPNGEDNQSYGEPASVTEAVV